MSAEIPWRQLELDEAVELLRGFPAPWWIGGGWAIDLHVGRITREHGDVDVVVLRDDRELLRDTLADWEVETGLDELRARRSPDGPWELRFLLTDAPKRRSLADVFLRSPDGIPYLRPEVVLLNKARYLRERDEWDFENVLPLLGGDARAWLRSRLPAAHPWRSRL